METKGTIFEISVDAKLLHERLKKVGIDEVISWEDLSEVISRDVRAGGSAYGALTTARRRALVDEGMVFDPVKGKGLKRLSDAEIVETSQAKIDSVRRRSRAALKRLACVQNFNGLPSDKQVKHNVFASIFSAFVMVTKAGPMKKLEDQVAEAQAQLPLAKTLEAFR